MAPSYNISYKNFILIFYDLLNFFLNIASANDIITIPITPKNTSHVFSIPTLSVSTPLTDNNIATIIDSKV